MSGTALWVAVGHRATGTESFRSSLHRVIRVDMRRFYWLLGWLAFKYGRRILLRRLHFKR